MSSPRACPSSSSWAPSPYPMPVMFNRARVADRAVSDDAYGRGSGALAPALLEPLLHDRDLVALRQGDTLATGSRRSGRAPCVAAQFGHSTTAWA